MALREVNDSNFESETGSGVVLLDMFSPSCGPCQQMTPVVEEIAGDYEGKAKIAKMDVTQNPDTPSKLGVMAVPTFVFMKDGDIVDTVVGAQPKNNLTGKLDELLS